MSGFASAIYEGRVRHRRHAPRAHAFEYRMAQLYLDLDEVDAVFRERWLWSVERPNLASFRRRDFLGDPAQPLAEAVRDRVERASGERPGGPVRLLTHLRYAGYSFNPVSFYYCHAADGALHSIVAEITNTPWKERHAYVLPLATALVTVAVGRLFGGGGVAVAAGGAGLGGGLWYFFDKLLDVTLPLGAWFN